MIIHYLASYVEERRNTSKDSDNKITRGDACVADVRVASGSPHRSRGDHRHTDLQLQQISQQQVNIEKFVKEIFNEIKFSYG